MVDPDNELFDPVSLPEWEPIATAPKDGSFILAWLDVGDNYWQPHWWCLEANENQKFPCSPNITVMRFWEGEWVSPAGEVGWEECTYPIKVKPTHWMPLPAAPEQEK